MAFAVARHRVEDYPKWKEVFDAFHETRKEAGELNSRLFHVAGEPNNIYLFQEWGSIEQLNNFFNIKS